ncbi:MAG: glutaredoxin [Rhodocyclaceae bacterium]|nr:glutaredoxin [Rhodocyclaceae bacterium]
MSPIPWQQHARRLAAIAALLFGLCAALSAAAEAGPTLEVFVREGCPHCAHAKRYLDRLRAQRPALRVAIHDIRKEPAALARLQELAAQADGTAPGVPSFYLEGKLIVGFVDETTTGTAIEALLDRQATVETPPAAAESVVLPWLGRAIGVEDLGLPLFTVLIGLLDGLNPCSMWVLVMMISLLAATRDRRKMLAIAGTFVAIEGIAYFAFMAAWLNLFLLIGISRASEIVLGAIALIAGLINAKDFCAFGRGITLSIPAAAKPGIYARMKRLLHEESLPLAIAGAALLAILVQIVELLCTSGLPALYTRILTLRNLDPLRYYGYLLLYNLMYMLDDVVVLTIGIVTLSRRRLQENEGRRLKLLSGVVMLLLGLYLLAGPH